jgi:hypothetical protein
MKRAAYAAFLVGLLASMHAGAEAPADRYMIDTAKSLVTDLRTGLIWQHPANTATYNWDQAVTYCRGLGTGFRMPTLKELLTLVDPTRVRPAIDIKAFPNTPAEWFWTSSNRAPAGPAAVSFATGGSGFYRATELLRVRCVR